MDTYILVPIDQVVMINEVPARPVDFSGIDPEIHAVSWYGTAGEVEFKWDPITNTKAPNLVITDFSPFQQYVDYAELVLEAQANPITIYATQDDLEYDGDVYLEGNYVVISDYPVPPVPAGWTSDAPPPTAVPEVVAQWDGNQWINSVFPIEYSLAQAQEFLTSMVNENGAELVNAQMANYSLLEIVTSPDPAALLPADSVTNLYPTVGDYQTAVDAITTPMLAEIAAAVNTAELFQFNTTVPEPPVYTP